MKLRFTPAAQDDIDRIFRLIVTKKSVAAQQVEDALRSQAEVLGRFPGIGAATDLEDVRRIPLVRHPYTIFYRVAVAEDAVILVRVVHAASIRNLRNLPEKHPPFPLWATYPLGGAGIDFSG